MFRTTLIPTAEVEGARREASSFGVTMTIEEAEFGEVFIDCTRGAASSGHLAKVASLVAVPGLLGAIVGELIGEVEEEELGL